MKGKSKYIVPILLAGVTATAGVAPAITEYSHAIVRADEVEQEQEEVVSNEITNLEGAEVKLDGETGILDTYPIGKKITLPSVTATGDYKVVYTIYRGTKEVKKLTQGTDALEFTPNYTGAYDIVITAEKSGHVITELKNITIMVEKTEATINMPVNSNYVIPAKLPVSNERGLTIPAPTVTIGDNETPTSAAEAGLVVELVTPSPTTPVIPLELDEEINAYKVTKAQLATAGTYQIRYKYMEDNVVITKLETNFQVVKDLQVPTNLYFKPVTLTTTGNVNEEIKIPKATVVDSKTSSDGINAHVTVTLTKLKSDGTPDGDPVEIDDYTVKEGYYHYTVKEEGTYIVSYEADLNSVYSGVKNTMYSPSGRIKITDAAKPKVRPTYAYKLSDGKVVAMDKDGNSINKTESDSQETINGYYEVNFVETDKVEDHLVDRKVDVPSIVIRKSGVAKFRLPAIYGTDNKDTSLTYTRQVVGNQIATKTITAPANEWSEEITLTQTGNYEIRYIAEDDDGNKVRATYSLVVKDEADVKDGETTLNLSIGVSSISDKETLSFSAPTVTDTYDSNLDVTLSYIPLKENTSYDPENDDIKDKYIEFDESYRVDLTKDFINDKTKKYEINIAEKLLTSELKSAGVVAVRVYAQATADSSLLGTRTAFATSTTTETYKDIKIVDSSNDKTAAVMNIITKEYDNANEVVNANTMANWNSELLRLNVGSLVEAKETINAIGADGYATLNGGSPLLSNGGEKLGAFDQGNKTIKLPKVSFTDSDENLRISVSIVDRFGNKVTRDGFEKRSTDGEVHTIDGISFKPSASGVYTVTYRAEDTRGNVTVKSFGIRVNDKTAPTIVVDDEDKYGVDVEVGKFFEVPYGTLIKDGKVVEGDVFWNVTYSDGAECEISSTGFTPLTEGTYYISYYGEDTYDNEQMLQDNSLFYVNAKDTTAPVFNDDSSYSLPSVMTWAPDANKQMLVEIPVLYATDPIQNKSVDVVYTVTGPDGTKVTIEDYDLTQEGNEDKVDVRYFYAKKQGVYTIKYEATDASNNKVTETKEVAVGDCEAPTLTWTEDYKIETEKKLGDKLDLKLRYLELSDNVTTDKDYLEDNMTITLVKPDGTTKVTNNGTDGVNYSWDLTETGAYTLKVVVEDEAGMTNTYKYTINVSAEEVEDNKVGSVVGTVLIIVSVVILAGVVIYFVVSSRKKATVKPARKKKD